MDIISGIGLVLVLVYAVIITMIALDLRDQVDTTQRRLVRAAEHVETLSREVRVSTKSHGVSAWLSEI